MKKVHLQIPEPCHEDWNKMTSSEKGRYCNSCCKEVIDFSFMSDQEILNYLSKPKGNTCGRFLPEQLNRTISEPKPPSKKWSWGVLMSFLMTVAGACKFRSEATVGKIAMIPEENKTALLDPVVSDTIKDVPQADTGVIIEEIYVVGELAPPVPVIETDPQKPIEPLATPEIDSTIEITCDLEPVTVTAVSGTVGRLVTLGGVSVVEAKTISTPKAIVDTVKAVFNIPSVRLYPNPATKASVVNVAVNMTGDYMVALYDNQSRMIQQSSFSIVQKNQAYQLHIPSSVANGMYYVRITDKRSKKQFTEKLIIQ